MTDTAKELAEIKDKLTAPKKIEVGSIGDISGSELFNTTSITEQVFPMHVREAEALVGVVEIKAKSALDKLLKTSDFNKDGKIDLGELEVAVASELPKSGSPLSSVQVLAGIGKMDPEVVDKINVGPEELTKAAATLKTKIREAAGEDKTLTKEEAVKAIQDLGKQTGLLGQGIKAQAIQPSAEKAAELAVPAK